MSSLDWVQQQRKKQTEQPEQEKQVTETPVETEETAPTSSLDWVRQQRESAQPQETPKAYNKDLAIGDTVLGYKFIGGDASEEDNWEKINNRGGEPWENFEESEGFDAGFETSEMPDAEIDAIAKLRGVDVALVREMAAIAGAKQDGEQSISGILSRSAGLGIPNLVGKKMMDDPQARKAFDDLQRIADNRRSWAQTAAETIGGFGGIPALGKAVAKTAGKGLGKLLAKEAIEGTVKRSATEGATIGGISGLGFSREGKEVESTLYGIGGGALLAGMGGYVAKTIGKKAGVADKAVAKELVEELAADTKISREIQETTTEFMEYKPQELLKAMQGRVKPADLTEELRTVPPALRKDHATQIRRAEKQAEALRKDQIKDFGRFLSDREGISYQSSDRLIREKIKDGEKYFRKEVENYVGTLATRSVLEKQAANTPPDMQANWRSVRYTLSDARYVYKELDELHPDLDLKLEPLVDQMSGQYDRMTWVLSAAQKRFAVLNKRTRKNRIKQEDLHRALEEGKPVGTVKADLLKSWQDEFEFLRLSANKILGEDVIKREENYVRRVLVSPERAIMRIFHEADKLGLTTNKPLDADSFARLATSTKGKSLIDMVEYTTKDKIKSGADLMMGLRAARDPRGVRENYMSKAGTFLDRAEDGGMPPELIEKDVRRAYQNWINTTFKHVFLRDSIADLRMSSQKLKAAGDTKGARYLRKHISYLNGTNKDWKIKEVPDRWVTNFKVSMGKRALKETDPKKKKFFETMEYMPDLLSKTRSTMYQNFLSTPRAIYRNLSQPWVMTAPELFSGSAKQAPWAYSKIPKAYLNTLTNWKKTTAELKERGHLPDHFVGEGLDHIKKGLADSAASRGVFGNVDKAAEQLLIGYQMSDTVNRAVTLHIAKQVGDDFLKGRPEAIRYVQNLGRGVRRQIKMELEKGDSEGVKDAIIDQLISATQFRYNGTALSQFGRDAGPIFSVFTKWPLAVAGDIVNRVQTKGAGEGAKQVLTKYFGPLVGLMTMDSLILEQAAPGLLQDNPLATDMIHDKKSDRYQTIVGKGGYKNFAPVLSAKVSIPPVLRLGWSAVSSVKRAVENEDVTALTGVVIDGVYQMVPLMGGVRLITDDFVNLMTGDRPEGRNFVDRAVKGAPELLKMPGQLKRNIQQQLDKKKEK
jgi:hypothetical protein